MTHGGCDILYIQMWIDNGAGYPKHTSILSLAIYQILEKHDDFLSMAVTFDSLLTPTYYSDNSICISAITVAFGYTCSKE